MLPKHLAFFFLLFLVGLVSLTTIVVLQNANSYRNAALQEEQQQKVRLRVAPTIEKPTELELEQVNKLLELNKKKQAMRQSTKPEDVITEETHQQEVIASAVMDDAQTPITDGYFDEKIITPPIPNDPKRDAVEKSPEGEVKFSSSLNSVVSIRAESPKTTISLCRNTVVGNMFISDSRGYTCRIENVDRVTRCCSTQPKPTTTRYSCKTCNLKYGCCSVYEYCVSCCMTPERRQELKDNFEKRKDDRLYRGVTTVFQFCSTRCRTTSRSVINENRYRSPLKHCYAQSDPADIEFPLTAAP